MSTRISTGSETMVGETDATDLRSQLYELRADVVSHMTQALDGLNAFEEAKNREPGADTEEAKQERDALRQERLRMQTIAEVPRTGAGRQEGGVDGLLEALKRRETECAELTKELRELSAQNRSLVSEVSGLSSQLRLAGTKAGQPISSSGITAEDVAVVTARKVSEMMPILSDIRVSNTWLSSKSMESFLQLADLTIQDPDRAPSARKVAKICVLIAQLVGPCKPVSSLGNVMRVRLENDATGCLQLVKHLKIIYSATRDDAASRVLLTEILSRMQANLPTFDSAVSLLAHLSSTLPALLLSHFARAFFNYLEEPDETTSKWLIELAALPVQWDASIKNTALGCVQSLLYAIAEQKFHKSCLQLLELLVHQQVPDQEPMLTFIMKAADAIKCGNLTVTSLIHKLYSFIHTYPDQVENAFKAMKLFPGADTTKEKVTLLMCQLESLSSNRHTSMNWLYNDWSSATEALTLQKQLTESEGLEESAQVGENLFTALSAILTSAEAQTCIKLMRRLYEVKEGKRDGLMFSLISLVKTNLASLFLKELAALPEEHATPAQVEETSKLLNLVRKYPSEDLLTAARHLASMMCLLRNENVQDVILTRELKIVLKQRTESLKKLLTALKPMVKSEPASCPLAVRLLSLLPKVPDELVYLMLFVPEVEMNLASAPMLTGTTAVRFCLDVLVKSFEVKNLTLLKIMRSQLQDGKLMPLAELLRKSQKEHLTILDVYELNLLPNVKPDCIQVFDCMRNETEAVLTRQAIKVDTSSSFVFIDNGNIFVCGGQV